jgi:hypothetical protein
MSEKTPLYQFKYEKPNDTISHIITTGIASMGGQCGSHLGLLKPKSETTSLMAKINGYCFGFFQAGDEWGRAREVRVSDILHESDTVHAENYLLAALEDSWHLLLRDGIIAPDVTPPSITIKITKTPCDCCAAQLVNFASEHDCSLRLKAAELWAHSSNNTLNMTAIEELGEAGITVIPWDLLAKMGKKRKNGGAHELGFLDAGRINMKERKALEINYAILKNTLKLNSDNALNEALNKYKTKSLSRKLTEEENDARVRKQQAEVLSAVKLKLGNEERLIKKRMDAAENKAARNEKWKAKVGNRQSEPRETVKEKTKQTKENANAKRTDKLQEQARKIAQLKARQMEMTGTGTNE